LDKGGVGISELRGIMGNQVKFWIFEVPSIIIQGTDQGFWGTAIKKQEVSRESLGSTFKLVLQFSYSD
jgi:hypothetical protein